MATWPLYNCGKMVEALETLSAEDKSDAIRTFLYAMISACTGESIGELIRTNRLSVPKMFWEQISSQPTPSGRR